MEDTQDLSTQVTFLQEHVMQWESRLRAGEAESATFREVVAELRAAVEGVGRAAFLQLVQACETDAKVLVGGGQVYRFKQDVDKE